MAKYVLIMMLGVNGATWVVEFDTLKACRDAGELAVKTFKPFYSEYCLTCGVQFICVKQGD